MKERRKYPWPPAGFKEIKGGLMSTKEFFKIKTEGRVDDKARQRWQEQAYRRGYRHGYSQGMDDVNDFSWNKAAKFFDKILMPWVYFKKIPKNTNGETETYTPPLLKFWKIKGRK